MKLKRSLRYTMLVLFSISASANAFLQTTPQSPQRYSRHVAANKRQQLDDVLKRFAAFGFSGTVLVAERGEVLLDKGYGLADRQRQIPNTAATIYPFASIIKGFTAAAIYKLEAEGKLNTADPITKYLTGVPSYASHITLLHLLTHSSGIPHEADNVPGGGTRGEHVKNILRLPLQSEPGTRYSYSNAGYDLLAAVVEQVTGVPFESYLHENLFQPAGLSHTGWRSEFPSRLFARGYQEVYRDTNSEITFPLGLVGTPEDLYKWSEALYTNRVLPLTARTKLFTPAFGDYVNGWWVTKTKHDIPVQITDGDYPGYQARMDRFPSRRLTIVLAMNNDSGWGQLVSNALQDILLGEKYEAPPLARKIGDAQLNSLSGKYELSSGATLEVRVADGALFVDPAGQQAISALAGVEATRNAQLIERNKVVTDFVEHLKQGEFDWIKPMAEFQSPEPYQRLRNFWNTMISSKGQLKGFQIIGSSPSRGALVLTSIRFDLEHGSEYWNLWWWDKKLRGWDINVSQPSAIRFLATSLDEFASLDIPTGRVTRIRFHEKSGELSIPSASGDEISARKVK